MASSSPQADVASSDFSASVTDNEGIVLRTNDTADVSSAMQTTDKGQHLTPKTTAATEKAAKSTETSQEAITNSVSTPSASASALRRLSRALTRPRIRNRFSSLVNSSRPSLLVEQQDEDSAPQRSLTSSRSCQLDRFSSQTSFSVRHPPPPPPPEFPAQPQASAPLTPSRTESRHSLYLQSLPTFPPDSPSGRLSPSISPRGDFGPSDTDFIHWRGLPTVNSITRLSVAGLASDGTPLPSAKLPQSPTGRTDLRSLVQPAQPAQMLHSAAKDHDSPGKVSKEPISPPLPRSTLPPLKVSSEIKEPESREAAVPPQANEDLRESSTPSQEAGPSMAARSAALSANSESLTRKFLNLGRRKGSSRRLSSMFKLGQGASTSLKESAVRTTSPQTTQLADQADCTDDEKAQDRGKRSLQLPPLNRVGNPFNSQSSSPASLPDRKTKLPSAQESHQAPACIYRHTRTSSVQYAEGQKDELEELMETVLTWGDNAATIESVSTVTSQVRTCSNSVAETDDQSDLQRALPPLPKRMTESQLRELTSQDRQRQRLARKAQTRRHFSQDEATAASLESSDSEDEYGDDGIASKTENAKREEQSAVSRVSSQNVSKRQLVKDKAAGLFKRSKAPSSSDVSLVSGSTPLVRYTGAAGRPWKMPVPKGTVSPGPQAAIFFNSPARRAAYACTLLKLYPQVESVLKLDLPSSSAIAGPLEIRFPRSINKVSNLRQRSLAKRRQGGANSYRRPWLSHRMEVLLHQTGVLKKLHGRLPFVQEVELGWFLRDYATEVIDPELIARAIAAKPLASAEALEAPAIGADPPTSSARSKRSSRSSRSSKLSSLASEGATKAEETNGLRVWASRKRYAERCSMIRGEMDSTLHIGDVVVDGSVGEVRVNTQDCAISSSCPPRPADLVFSERIQRLIRRRSRTASNLRTTETTANSRSYERKRAPAPWLPPASVHRPSLPTAESLQKLGLEDARVARNQLKATASVDIQTPAQALAAEFRSRDGSRDSTSHCTSDSGSSSHATALTSTETSPELPTQALPPDTAVKLPHSEASEESDPLAALRRRSKALGHVKTPSGAGPFHNEMTISSFKRWQGKVEADKNYRRESSRPLRREEIGEDDGNVPIGDTIPQEQGTAAQERRELEQHRRFFRESRQRQIQNREIAPTQRPWENPQALSSRTNSNVSRPQMTVHHSFSAPDVPQFKGHRGRMSQQSSSQSLAGLRKTPSAQRMRDTRELLSTTIPQELASGSTGATNPRRREVSAGCSPPVALSARQARALNAGWLTPMPSQDSLCPSIDHAQPQSLLGGTYAPISRFEQRQSYSSGEIDDRPRRRGSRQASVPDNWTVTQPSMSSRQAFGGQQPGIGPMRHQVHGSAVPLPEEFMPPALVALTLAQPTVSLPTNMTTPLLTSPPSASAGGSSAPLPVTASSRAAPGVNSDSTSQPAYAPERSLPPHLPLQHPDRRSQRLRQNAEKARKRT